MTTLSDMLVDLIEDYDTRKAEIERTALDDDLPDAIEELKEEVIEEFLETVKKRLIG